MTYDRGFKAHANRIALEVRRELHLDVHEPLCPWRLAESLAIPVIPLRGLNGRGASLAKHIDYLVTKGAQFFSALAVFRGSRRLIIHNDAHAPTRQRSDLAHELAHALLMHPPHPPFCSNGERIFDAKLEKEAGWLGPVLLVPNEAARGAAATGLAEDPAAQTYGVSKDLIRFRMRMSGATRLISHTSRRVGH